MSNISIKVNLRQFKHVVKELKGKDGNKIKCLVIPIAENHFIEGEKGVYVDLMAFEIKNKSGDKKDTHFIKQSLPKKIYEKLTKEEKYDMPFVGNATVWGSSENEPNDSQDIDLDEDDLPF